MARQIGKNEIMNQGEAARYLRVTPKALRRYADEIPHRRLGRNIILFDKGALDAWLSGEVLEVSK